MSDHATDLTTLAARTVMASFDDDVLPDWARRRLADGMGGICLFGENVTSIEAIGRLCADIHEAAPDAIVSLDEEGGDVTRLYYQVGSPHAGHAALGAVDYPSLTREVAQDIGSELRDLGVDLDLAPVADVNSNPHNPVIGVRSFGAEPELVSRHVAAFVEGLQAAGVGACLKHFPGHGDTVADSHVALPVAEASVEVLRARELVPFRAGIAADAVAVMTSHVVVRALDPNRPATFSPVATRLLRAPEPDGGLGFDGAAGQRRARHAGGQRGDRRSRRRGEGARRRRRPALPRSPLRRRAGPGRARRDRRGCAVR